MMFDPVQPFQLLTATHAILFCGEGRHVDPVWGGVASGSAVYCAINHMKSSKFQHSIEHADSALF